MDRQGPFGGVYSALRRLQKPILVLSCDLPFMDGPTLRRLLDAREARLPGTIMTTYQQEETGFIEALVAVYEPACLPWFDAAWEQGIRKFSVVIPEELRTHVPYSRSEALPFFNINCFLEKAPPSPPTSRSHPKDFCMRASGRLRLT